MKKVVMTETWASVLRIGVVKGDRGACTKGSVSLLANPKT